MLSARDFLDLEATAVHEDEEEEEEEENLSDLFNDDDVSSDGLEPLDDISHVGGFPSSAVRDLEDEARRIVERGLNTRSSIPTIEDLVLPFRVPRDTDPSIWSVRVKLGQEANIVLQICRRCLEPSESQPPAITSAFARSSIPGYVFIEAYNVGEVRHAVDGFVTVYNKQPHFIAPTEYVGLLSRNTLSSSRVEAGQWVCCLVGRYRNDLGYVIGTDEWDANVVFVPRIPESRGKRQRGGRPPPRTWTIAEIVQRYGNTRVQVQGPNKIAFGRSVYEDGLVMVWVPMSHLLVSNHSPGNIAPFMRSTILRKDDLFNACVKRFAQDSTQVGDRILVVSGEHAGIIGRIERIHDNVADVVAQSPEEHLELVVRIVLRDLMPHFLAGDHVKDRWSDHTGIVVAVDNDDKELTFLCKETNEVIVTSTLGVQFYSSPLRFFRFTPGLFVEFPGTAGVTCRGYILQALDGNVQVMNERDGQMLDVKEDEITVSGVQASTFFGSKQRWVWEDQRVVIARGPLKGYHGLVKAQYDDGVDVELDAKLASGQTRQRFLIEDVSIECLVEHIAMPVMPVASSSRLSGSPPPEVMAHPLTLEPEEPEESIPCGTAQRPTWKHWILAEEIQEILRDACIPFYIRGVPASSPHAKYEGCSTKTVVVAKRNISPEPNEVVVIVAQRAKRMQISIDPSFLIPWDLTEGSKVVIVGDRWIGQVGKLVKLDHGCCTVRLASSSEPLYFTVADVVLILDR